MGLIFLVGIVNDMFNQGIQELAESELAERMNLSNYNSSKEQTCRTCLTSLKRGVGWVRLDQVRLIHNSTSA